MVAQGQAAHQHEFPSSISPVNTLYWTFAGIRRPSGISPLSISFFICLVSNHYTFCRWTLILISNIKFRESCPIACARAPIKSSAFCNRNIFVAFMVGCQFWLLSPPRRGWGWGRGGMAAGAMTHCSLHGQNALNLVFQHGGAEVNH